MTDAYLGPIFTGTPDQWWEQAEPITEAEAAERVLGTWYILAETRAGEHTGSYRISLPTLASNLPRKDALERRIHLDGANPDDISPNVRALIRVSIERPDWMEADLVIADAELGSSERVPWRQKNAKWMQVFNPTKSAGERRMAELNPIIAAISELNAKETP